MLQNSGYVELRAKALRPLERGQLLSTMLVAHLGQFVESAFTSRLESDLDAISAGELDSTSFLAQWSVPSLPPPRATRPYRAARALTCDAPFSRWSTFEPACAAVAAIDTQTLRNQVRLRVSGVAASPVRACRPVPEPATQRARACNPMCQVADQLAERLFPTVERNEPPLANGIAPIDVAAAPDRAQRGSVPAVQAAEGAAAAASGSAVAQPERPCPGCGSGTMALKFSRYGPFIGCSEYPNCSWTRQLSSAGDGDEDAFKARVLGVQPSGDALMDDAFAGLEVSLRKGPYGHYVQLGGNLSRDEGGKGAGDGVKVPEVKQLKVAELRQALQERGLDTVGKKPELAARLLLAPDLRHLVAHKRVSLPPATAHENVTLPMALRLLSMPLRLGAMPDGAHSGCDVTLAVGKFGPYVKLHAQPPAAAEADADAEEAEEAEPPKDVLAALPKGSCVYTIALDEAVELLKRRLARGPGRGRGRGRGRGKPQPARAGRAAAKKRQPAKG